MLIGKVLKGLREAREWTQTEAALRGGIPPGQWSQIEADNRPGLTVDMFRRLAMAFSMSGSDLLELIEISEDAIDTVSGK